MAAHTVLVADDSQTVRRIIEMACAGEDIEVVSVPDGELAIARIAERPPDIVLADMAMPRRDGYDVAAFIKGRADLAHIPVLLLAGMFETADEARAKSLGCVEVLVKPLKPMHVLERVRYWLDAAASGQRVDAATPTGNQPSEPSEHEPLAAPSPVSEDYFSRLDAAFKSLERPLGTRLGEMAGPLPKTDASGPVEAVPTLQQLLDRLPHETRSQLSAVPPPGDDTPAPEVSDALSAIATHVLTLLSSRDDLLDEIARRVARLRREDDHR